ncbi:MAG TPA: glycosyltransferase, partial [Longimicrobiaceae bacterium]
LRPGRVGLVAALNLGIAEARALLVARMDADDVMLPERLRAQRGYMDAHPELALCGTRVELFPADEVRGGYLEYVRWQNECVTPDAIAANLYVESPFAHPSVVMRTEVLRAAGGYADGPFPEDYELWLRLHAAGHRMGKVPRVLLRWRERGGRTSRVDVRYARGAFDRLRADYLARDPRLHAGREVVVWGAGRRSRLRARLVMERGIAPVAWIDIDPDKIGHRVWGLAVHPPEWLETRDPRPFVLVYVNNHGARDLISARLAEMGYAPGDDWLGVG